MAKSKKMTAKVKLALIRKVGEEGEDFDSVIAELGITEDQAVPVLEEAGFERCDICGNWSDCLNGDGECEDCTSSSDPDGDGEGDEDEDLFKDPEED